ncbi:glycosyltransferase family 8 protein [Saccharibacillus sacchari]|uniref:glycosyltransferase family 8 protein n=1 Tax=Saccharibacillus sacchari TaxID=456493 RepID=UPI0004B43789|nr:glycosyltransferase family 8 protein [Saccharibacillus sacchari]
MNIVFTIDRNYIQHLCVTLKSILRHTKTNLSAYIIGKDLGEPDRRLIEENFIDDEIRFFFIEINPDRLLRLGIDTNHLPIEVLFRLVAPELLPDSVEKAIFMDCDIVVLDDLAILYETELEGYLLGAVVDIIYEAYRILNLDSILDYFNAGVMLIDIFSWRKQDFTAQALKYASENAAILRYADQDILNGLLRGVWKRLPQQWNVITNLFENPTVFQKTFGEERHAQVSGRPSLVHFTGDIKPWSFFSNHPYRDRYDLYYRMCSGFAWERKSSFAYACPLYLFGSSVNAIEMSKKLEAANMTIQGYIDNDRQKQGLLLREKPIIAPDTYNAAENSLIIIASSYTREISEQLEQMGLIYKQDFFKNLSEYENYLTGCEKNV